MRIVFWSAALVGLACSSSAVNQTSPEKAERRDELGTPVDAIVDFTLGGARRNNPSRRDFNEPIGVAIDPVAPNAVFVADRGNQRILAWRSAAAFRTQQLADVEIPSSFQELVNISGMTVSGDGRVLVFGDYDPGGCDSDCSRTEVTSYASPFRNTPDGGTITPTSTSTAFYWFFRDGKRYSAAAIDSVGRVFVGAGTRVFRFPSSVALEATAGFAPPPPPIGDAVLGQPNFVAFRPNGVDGTGFDGPNGVAVDESTTPNRLYVADTNNNRVLVWLDVSAAGLGAPADLVVGQPDFGEQPCPTVPAERARTLCRPTRVRVDGVGRLYVLDGACRVVGFDRPMANHPLIARVWGQVDTTASQCAVVSPTTFYSPTDIAVNPRGDLFVSDTARVLRFPAGAAAAWPATTPAQEFAAVNCAPPFASPCFPTAVAATNSTLFILESARALMYPGLSDGGFASDPSNVVLGKPTLDAGSANPVATTANTFGLGSGIEADPSTGAVYISDLRSARILRFDPPFAPFEAAAAVIGQPDFTSSSFQGPFATYGMAATSGGLLFVTQPTVHRVARLGPTIPQTGAVISQLVGQRSAQNTSPNGLKPGSLHAVSGIAIDRSTTPNTLWVADSVNRRILGWPTTDVTTNQPPSVVLGPTDFTSMVPLTPRTARSFTPGALAASGGVVVVEDVTSRRLLAFRMDGGAPFAVYGQPDFVSQVSDGGVLDQVSGAIKLDSVLGDFLAAHGNGNRVLWLQTDGGSRLSAVTAAGQDRLDLDGPNRVKSTGFNAPVAVAVDRSVIPNRLYVVDSNNHRLLVFNDVTAISNGRAADAVIGQPTFSDFAPGAGPNRFNFPSAVAIETSSGRVAVADSNNHRVLLFDAPFADGGDLVADVVIGQDSFLGTGQNRDGGAASAATLFDPVAVHFGPARELLVADRRNHRVLWFNPPLTTAMPASFAFGQPNLTSNSAAGCGTNLLTRLCLPFAVNLRSLPDAGTSLFVSDSTQNAFFSPPRLLRFDTPLPADRTAELISQGTIPAGNFDFDSFGTMFWGSGYLSRCVAPYASCSPFGATSQDRLGAPSFDDDGTAYVASPRGMFGGLPLYNTVSVLLGDSAPVALDAGIAPSPARSADTLVGVYRFIDADGDVERGSTFRWFKDGVEQPGLTTATVAASLTTRGDSWEFEVTPRDIRRAGDPLRSAPSIIQNTPPVVLDAGITPSVAFTDEPLLVSYAAVDDDLDPLGAPGVQWELETPSGFFPQALFNDALTLPATATTRGQRWRARIEAFDGSDRGPAFVTAPTLIANSPPRAVAGPDIPLRPSGPTTMVRLDGTGSTDADGDNLSFTWREGSTVLGTGNLLTVFLTEGLHIITLEAYDGFDRATDEVLVDISSVSPDAGIVTVGGDVPPGWVTLAGVADDPLNRPLRFQWSQQAGPMVTLLDPTMMTARFFAVERGARTFRFQATAGATPGSPRDLTLTTTNLGPWPGWLPRLVARPQGVLVLAPRAIDDANGDPVTNVWASQGGTLRQGTNGSASLTVTQVGVFTLSHDVDDGQGASASASTEVVVVGPSKEVFVRTPSVVATSVGTSAPLDASRSFTLDGRPISFLWTVVAGQGRLANSRSSMASFTPDGTATATLRVTATTSEGGSDTRDVKVLVNAPTAMVAPVPLVKVADTVTLDASRSFDRQGLMLAFTWTQTGGPPVTLQASGARATFTALRPGRLRFNVVADNGALSSLPETVDVVVTSGTNQRPVANAGSDFETSPGTEFTLSSSQSTDPDGDPLTPQWQQLSGPPLPLDPSADVLRLTAAVPGTYRFELTVWDREVPSEPRVINVRVSRASNTPPVALIDGPASGKLNEPLSFSGATSSDPDGDALTFRWSLTGFPTGAKPTLSDDTQPQATLAADMAGPYTLRLIVSDGAASSAPAERVVFIGQAPGSGCGCNEVPVLPSLVLALIAASRVRLRSKR